MPRPSTKTATRSRAAARNTADAPALYEQVKDYIVAQIRNGALAPGHRMPSEFDLCRALGVSRMTANRAVRELANAGVVSRIAGVGTFVASPRLDGDLLEVRNIAAEIRERGGRYSSKLHYLGTAKASAPVAQWLGIEVGKPVFRSMIVHLENALPVQLEDRFVNPATVPDYLGIDFGKTTPNAYLCQIAPITDVEHVIEAILPDATTQDLLKVPAHEPCIRLYRATSSFRRKLTCVWLTYAGRQHRLSARFSLQRVRNAKHG